MIFQLKNLIINQKGIENSDKDFFFEFLYKKTKKITLKCLKIKSLKQFHQQKIC